jgi:hypothetical protein
MGAIGRLGAASILAGSLLWAGGATAAEEGKSVYLLGAATSMAGVTPPPGFYFSSFTYFYEGNGSGNTALSWSLSRAGTELPPLGVLQTNASLSVKAQVGINIFTLIYVAPEQVLGGNAGFGVLAPVGYQGVDLDVTALSSLTLPNGNTLQTGRVLRESDHTFAFGDPLATAFIGWNSSFFHWKLTGLLNVPVGDYSATNLVNMGFNRWAGDLTGSMTYLNPQSGLEVSGAVGFTFNGENPATKYRTGTEFHFEGALMEHFSKDFAIGVAGYHYEQITGDSGAGAVIGPFKGRVSALGPNLTYNLEVGGVLLLTSVKYMREFDAENRLSGNVGMFTLTIPLGEGKPSPTHSPG